MLRISFDFDEVTKSVTNVTVNGKSKSTTISVSSPDLIGVAEPDVEVQENKLKLSRAAIAKLKAKADDRISIQYISEGVGKACPVIGKAEVFTDRRDGNRLAKAGTVSFRGEKRATLAEFGTMFTLEEYKDGIWKLVEFVSTDNSSDSLIEEEQDAEALNGSEIEQEIAAITTDDDLPF